MNLKEPEDEYDLIVSNPPFYTEDYKTDNEQRDLATRHMPDWSCRFIPFGKRIFAVIIPFKEENFLAVAYMVV
jgi:tRNA1Val (adenine37-N6)-methyltransferase